MCKRLSCAVDTECSSLKQGMICGSSNDVTRGHNALAYPLQQPAVRMLSAWSIYYG
jgi:hypothetical protein